MVYSYSADGITAREAKATEKRLVKFISLKFKWKKVRSEMVFCLLLATTYVRMHMALMVL